MLRTPRAIGKRADLLRGHGFPALGSQFQLLVPPRVAGVAGEGWGRSAGSCVNRFPSRDTPVSWDGGLYSCAGPAWAAARERGGREPAARSRPRPGLAGAGNDSGNGETRNARHPTAAATSEGGHVSLMRPLWPLDPYLRRSLSVCPGPVKSDPENIGWY